MIKLELKAVDPQTDGFDMALVCHKLHAFCTILTTVVLSVCHYYCYLVFSFIYILLKFISEGNCLIKLNNWYERLKRQGALLPSLEKNKKKLLER